MRNPQGRHWLSILKPEHRFWFLFITTMLTSLTWSLWSRVLSSAAEIAAPWSSVQFPLDRDSGCNLTSFLCIRFYTVWRWWCPELETMGFGVNRPNWRPGHHLPVSLLHLSKLDDHLSPTSGRAREAGSVMPDTVKQWMDVNGIRISSWSEMAWITPFYKFIQIIQS